MVIAKTGAESRRKRSVQRSRGPIRPELARIGGVKLSVRDSDWGGNQKLLMLDVAWHRRVTS
jgi:hypothetical protein